MPHPDSPTDLRLLLPETVWLEAEHFTLAKQTSSLNTTTEEKSWQVYLNTLGLLALEVWLNDRLGLNNGNNSSSQPVIERDINTAIAIAGSLKLGDYKFCAIASEHFLDEIVRIPQQLIEKPELTPHFYVLLEVLEEAEEAVIRGFLPHNQLVEIQNNQRSPLDDGCYQIPLSSFDIEPNHLLAYYRYVQPSEFTVPIVNNQVESVNSISENVTNFLSDSTTKLSQWLQGVIDEGWQTIDSLINPELSFAFRTRNREMDTKRAKILNLGLDLGSKKFALLLNISSDVSPDTPADAPPETVNKIRVLAQLYPLEGERFLPPNIQLTLLSKAGKTLQEVTARVHDNYIQLKPFKGEPGKNFTLQVSLGDVSVKENFEL
ncbi:DUF1822 family protein [Calothrix sp. 336/3]|uniref:DUF1822 family protein n=1 Tax=Calothrix sp. 336/3 TaxID=1337936 RepID=UPI0004E3A759|nr:DUF1822 family protein [Calothrix sp. 336/3]